MTQLKSLMDSDMEDNAMDWILSSIFPATFPNCADAILALKNREQREGTRAVPDSPNLNLSLVREWHHGRVRFVEPNEYRA